MTISLPNRIFLLLMRGYKGPSPRAATWLGVGIGLAGSALCLLVTALIPPDFGLGLAGFASMVALAVAFLNPFAGLILASGLMGELVKGDGLERMRQSGRRAEKIERSSVVWVSDRLRLHRTIGLAALLAGLVGCAFMLGIDQRSAEVPPSVLPVALNGWLPALAVIAASMAVNRLAWGWCMRIGVWLGLWLRRTAPFAGSAATLIGIVGLFALLGGLNSLAGDSYWGPPLLASIGPFVILPALIGLLSWVVRQESIRIIEGTGRLAFWRSLVE